MAPEKYRQLCWVEAEIWGLHDSPSLSVAKAPENMDVLGHEAAAYAGKVPISPDRWASRSVGLTTDTGRSGGDRAAVGVDHPGVG
jgi:hypothetical protein